MGAGGDQNDHECGKGPPSEGQKNTRSVKQRDLGS